MARSQSPHSGFKDQLNFAKLDSPTDRFKPMLGVDVSAMGLKRSHTEATPLVFSDLAEVIATTDIVESDLTLGSRVAVTLFNLRQGVDLDFVFLGQDDTIANATVDTTGFATTNVHPFFYGGFPASAVPSYSLSLESEIKSFEVSIGYRPMERLRLTLGVRSFSLEEDFDILQTALLPTTIAGFFSNAQNDAVGIQLGGEATIWTNGRTRIFANGKYAFLNNDVKGDSHCCQRSPGVLR